MDLWQDFQIDGTYLLRLAAAFVLGGLIGLERQAHGRPAGLRTNIVVCLGSAAVVVAFQKYFAASGLDAESMIRLDPARAAAGVITGVGFLGAGTILKHDDLVRGLTTAASIWVVSAVGIVVGLGQYDLAIGVTILVLISLFGLDKLHISGARYGELRVVMRGDARAADALDALLADTEAAVKRRRLRVDVAAGEVQLRWYLRYREAALPRRIVADCAALEGVRSVEWA